MTTAIQGGLMPARTKNLGLGALDLEAQPGNGEAFKKALRDFAVAVSQVPCETSPMVEAEHLSYEGIRWVQKQAEALYESQSPTDMAYAGLPGLFLAARSLAAFY